jgi:hypothetical protein
MPKVSESLSIRQTIESKQLLWNCGSLLGSLSSVSPYLILKELSKIENSLRSSPWVSSQIAKPVSDWTMVAMFLGFGI